MVCGLKGVIPFKLEAGIGTQNMNGGCEPSGVCVPDVEAGYGSKKQI